MDIRRLHIVLAAALYTMLLMFSFRTVIAPDFYYEGLWYVPLQGLNLLITYTCAMLPALWVPLQLKRPSQLCYWVLYLVTFIPAVTVPPHSLSLALWDVSFFQLTLTFAFLFLGFSYQMKLIGLPRLTLSKPVFWICFAVVGIAGYAYIIRTTHADFVSGLSGFALGGNEYDLRTAYKKTGEFDHLLSYIVDWESNAINTFLFAYGITRRKWIMVALGTFGELFIFTVTGFRLVLFSTLLLLFVFFQLRRLQKSFAIFPLSFAGVILGSRLGDKILHSVSVSSIFVRRMILGPGLITGWYFEFFTANPKVLFTNSPFMKPFVRSFYVLQPSNEIAAAYMGRPETSANGNLFADGYGQLGHTGVILFGLALGLFFWIYDSVAKKRDWRLGALMITVPSLTLSNTAFFTSMVSHGVIMATLVQYFAPASRDELALERGEPAAEDDEETVPEDDGVVVS